MKNEDRLFIREVIEKYIIYQVMIVLIYCTGCTIINNLFKKSVKFCIKMLIFQKKNLKFK